VKRLGLNRDTIRELSEQEAEGIVGRGLSEGVWRPYCAFPAIMVPLKWGTISGGGCPVWVRWVAPVLPEPFWGRMHKRYPSKKKYEER
jgi:hypothetical protein